MQSPKIHSKQRESSYWACVIFGLWLGIEYAVVMAVRIFGHSSTGGTLDMTTVVIAVVWPLIFFAISRYPFIPARIRSGSFFSIAVFLLFCLLSSFLSPAALNSAAYTGMTLISIWIALEFISVMDGKQYEIGLKVYAIQIIALLVAFAWYDYVPGTRLGNGKEIFNPNSIALVSLSAALAAMAFRNWLIRYGLIAIVFVIIYLTGSRTSAISTLLGLTIIGYERTRSGKNTLKLLVALCLLVFLVAILAYWETLEPLIESFLQLHSEGRGIGSGATGRTGAWKQTWELFLGSPVLGVGFRAHESVLGGFSHNGYLATLAEIGLFGFIAVLYLIFSGTFLLWKKTREPEWTFSHSIIFGLCCANLFLAFFESYLINVGNPTSLLFLVAILSPILAPPKKKRMRSNKKSTMTTTSCAQTSIGRTN